MGCTAQCVHTMSTAHTNIKHIHTHTHTYTYIHEYNPNKTTPTYSILYVIYYDSVLMPCVQISCLQIRQYIS